MKDKKKVVAGGVLLASALAASFAIRNHNKTKTKTQLEVNSKQKLEDSPKTSSGFLGVDPATPLETAAFLESMTPSLMTRASGQQGVVTGGSVLGAKGISNVTETVTNGLLGNDKSYANRLVTRSALAAGGYALSKLPEKDDESLVVSSVRSAGNLIGIASLGGIVHDSMKGFSNKRTSKTKLVPMTLAALVATGIIYRGNKMLKERRSLIDTIPQDPSNKIIPATVASFVVISLLKLLGTGFSKTGQGLESWLGEGPLKKNVARFVNTSFWAGLAGAAYWGGVSKIGTANEVIEPSYSTPPKDPNVSGSSASTVDFIELGKQGRKFVSNAMSTKNIQAVTGKRAKKSPIRVYVGFDMPEKYRAARAEKAIEELKRTKALERKYLLLISPTGTGWIDHTSVESAELFSGGDIASVVVQYAKYPSFLALQKVHNGRRQFRELLWSVKLMLEEMPEEKRPKVLVFGLSLGAWSSGDTVMHTGISGFDHYHIDRALWAGMPGISKWGKIEDGEVDVDIPEGTIRIFDRPQEHEKLSKKEKSDLRAIILNHDDDPIARIRPKLIVKKPKWLTKGNRGRGVPKEMEWTPFFTFLQIAIDAANAMTVIPGKFRSHGHDYRKDFPYFVNEAYQMGASKATVRKAYKLLEKLEIERAEKSKELAADVE